MEEYIRRNKIIGSRRFSNYFWTLFLFIGGLTGLLFNELIITLSAAVVASLVIALTLVPAFGRRTSAHTEQKREVYIDRYFNIIRKK